MGMNQTTYIGPYIKIDKTNIKPLEKDNTITITTCTNTKCKIHGKKSVGKFCSSCGSPNGPLKQTHKVQIIPHAYDLLGEFGKEDLLYSPSERDDKSILFMPNRRNKYSVTVSDDNSFVEKPIPNQNLSTESFTQDYQEFINFLDKKDINYQIIFGVLSYWN